MAATAATKSVDISATPKVKATDLRQNQAGIIGKYARVPEKAEAVQFQGWSNATAIIDWMPGTYFVPQGYGHYLRYADEYVDGQGVSDQTLKPHADEFLVFKGADGKDYRIDLGFYLIRTEKGGLFFISAQQFREQYQESVLS
jgi:hypothetical protein